MEHKNRMFESYLRASLTATKILSTFAIGGVSDMLIGNTSVSMGLLTRALEKLGVYSTNKIYIYFKASALVFPVAFLGFAFIPPRGKYFDLYLELGTTLGCEVECVGLSDEVFTAWKEKSIVFSGCSFLGYSWVLDYYFNELSFNFLDKDNNNPSSAALSYRKMYDDLCLQEESEWRNLYISSLEKLHGNISQIDCIRVGNMDISLVGKVTWVMQNEGLPFVSGGFLTTLHTNIRYIPKIMESKAIFAQTKNRLSHAAVIAQELHLPCFIAIDNIFSKLFHGDIVSFQGNSSILSITRRFYERD